MKLLIKRQSLILIAIPATIFGGILTWYFPEFLLKTFFVHWLMLFLLIIIALIPFGKTRLTSVKAVSIRPASIGAQSNLQTLKDKAVTSIDKPKYPLKKWLLMIMVMQVALQILFIEIMYFVNYLMPIFVIEPQKINLTSSLIYLQLFQGLFPWAFFALHAVNLGLKAYREQKDAYFSSTFSKIFSTTPNQPLGVIANALARGANMLSLSTNLLLLSLWLVTLSTHWFWPLTTGFNLATLCIVVLILILSIVKKLKQFLIPASRFGQFDFYIKLGILLFIFSAFLFLLNSLFHQWESIPIKPPIFLLSLKNEIPSLFLLFMHVWWLFWLPSISITLAYFSEGYQVRSIFAGVLLWPLMSVILLLIWPSSLSIILKFPSFVNWLIAFTAFMIVMYCITSKNRLSLFTRCYLPHAPTIKIRPYANFLKRLPIFMAILLYVYLPAGIITLSPFCFIPVIPMVLLSMLGVISLATYCFQKHQ